MRCCGVDISASDAILVLLDGTRADFQHVEVDPRKIAMADDADPAMVRSFRDAIQGFIQQNHVETVAIKSRNKKGKFAGGATGFKIEAVLQLLDGCEIQFVSPIAVAALMKKASVTAPGDLKGYQSKAFEVAYTALPEE